MRCRLSYFHVTIRSDAAACGLLFVFHPNSSNFHHLKSNIHDINNCFGVQKISKINVVAPHSDSEIEWELALGVCLCRVEPGRDEIVCFRAEDVAILIWIAGSV